MKIFETERLVLRQLSTDDAAFILSLLNDPGWLQFIGDKGVRNLDDAKDYILQGPVAMYASHGFGLWLVEEKTSRVPTGLCGLIKRDSLEDVDIGYAFLPDYRALGYALESATAVMNYGHEVLSLSRIVAITSPDNQRSVQLLEKLQMRAGGIEKLTGLDGEVMFFTRDFPG